MSSPEAMERLARFPNLRMERQEFGPEEGMPPLRYLRSERDGVLIKCSSDGDILAIFLMSEGKDGFSQFEGALPGRLSFDSEPEEVLRAFGKPAYRRAPGKIGSVAVGELLRFDLPDYSVHFQFRPDNEEMDLVTAMTAASVPGRSAKQPR